MSIYFIYNFSTFCDICRKFWRRMMPENISLSWPSTMDLSFWWWLYPRYNSWISMTISEISLRIYMHTNLSLIWSICKNTDYCSLPWCAMWFMCANLSCSDFLFLCRIYVNATWIWVRVWDLHWFWLANFEYFAQKLMEKFKTNIHDFWNQDKR